MMSQDYFSQNLRNSIDRFFSSVFQYENESHKCYGIHQIEKSKIFIWTVLDVGMSLGANFLHTVSSLIPLDIQTTVLGWSAQKTPVLVRLCEFFLIMGYLKTEILKISTSQALKITKTSMLVFL